LLKIQVLLQTPGGWRQGGDFLIEAVFKLMIGGSNPTPTRETGLKTITINASVGSVARSIGVNLNIQ